MLENSCQSLSTSITDVTTAKIYSLSTKTVGGQTNNISDDTAISLVISVTMLLLGAIYATLH